MKTKMIDQQIKSNDETRENETLQTKKKILLTNFRPSISLAQTCLDLSNYFFKG